MSTCLKGARVERGFCCCPPVQPTCFHSLTSLHTRPSNDQCALVAMCACFRAPVCPLLLSSRSHQTSLLYSVPCSMPTLCG